MKKILAAAACFLYAGIMLYSNHQMGFDNPYNETYDTHLKVLIWRVYIQSVLVGFVGVVFIVDFIVENARRQRN